MTGIRNSHSHNVITGKQVLIPLAWPRVIGVNIDIWNWKTSCYLLHCSWDILCEFLSWLQRAGVDGFEDAAPITGAYYRWLIMTSLDVKRKQEVLISVWLACVPGVPRGQSSLICISMDVFLFLWLRYLPLPIMAMPILKSCCMMAASWTGLM